MPLSKEQEIKMYDDTIATKTIVAQIEKRLEKGDERLDDCGKRLNDVESEQKLLKGKIGFIVLILSVCFTAALHAIGWIVSHFWGKS